MMDPVYTFLEPFEGSVAGTATITFTLKTRRLTIMNDGLTDLQFRVSSDHTYATLKPSETVSLDITTKSLYLSGTTDYRVWGLG